MVDRWIYVNIKDKPLEVYELINYMHFKVKNYDEFNRKVLVHDDLFGFIWLDDRHVEYLSKEQSEVMDMIYG